MTGFEIDIALSLLSIVLAIGLLWLVLRLVEAGGSLDFGFLGISIQDDQPFAFWAFISGSAMTIAFLVLLPIIFLMPLLSR